MPHSVGTEAGTTVGFPLLQPVLPGFVTVNALSGDSRHKASTRSPLSVAARARIAAAQRARWAKVRGHGQQKQRQVVVEWTCRIAQGVESMQGKASMDSCPERDNPHRLESHPSS